MFGVEGFSPHRCEAWGSALPHQTIRIDCLVFQSSSVRGVGLGLTILCVVSSCIEVSVLIGARRGARQRGHRRESPRNVPVSVLIGARRGARLMPRYSARLHLKSFSPHRCEAWGSARRFFDCCSTASLFQSSSVRGVGLGIADLASDEDSEA